MATLSELRQEVYNILDDSQGITTNSGGYFTTEQVNRWLNYAQREVQLRLVKAGQNFYTKCIQTTLVINQRQYALPIDFKKLNRLEVITSGTIPYEVFNPVIPITTNQVDLVVNGIGVPNYYTIQNYNLFVRPAPDSTYVMRMIYTRMITDMVSDTDVADIPSDYDELLTLYAAQSGFLKDGRANDLLVKKIMEWEKKLDNDANERNVDVPRGVVITGFDNYSGWGY